MTAKYWQKGEVLDYKASAAVKNGEVVSLGTRIGVAGEDIAAGETGHLHVVGVFEMEKATGDVTMGAALYYSATDKKITTTASGNVPAGYAAASAASAASLVSWVVSAFSVPSWPPSASCGGIVASSAASSVILALSAESHACTMRLS